jgi:hypothetical protein
LRSFGGELVAGVLAKSLWIYLGRLVVLLGVGLLFDGSIDLGNFVLKFKRYFVFFSKT